jgi:superfamily I DNA/RNA helicase
MILQTLELFERYRYIVEEYRCWYRAILVDEFQDTNPLQIRLLQHLLGGGARLFAVGDDDQAIYGFRGADPGPTLEFRQRFAGARIVKLETNYRSTRSILCAANRIFAQKPPPYRKVLQPPGGTTGREERGTWPRICRFGSQQRMYRWAAQRLRRSETTEACGGGSTALLFRTNDSLQQCREWMQSRGGIAESPEFLTVHGSKGLEFDTVFLFDLEESVWPNYRPGRARPLRRWADLLWWCRNRLSSRTIDCDLTEEQRLFYVGVTRARRTLYLLCCPNRIVSGRLRRLRPSRFLKLI